MKQTWLIILKLIGVLLTALGLLALYYAPLELGTFYIFSEGGSAAYPGFQVGTPWFALLLLMNMGYYVLAALCLPLGIGHFLLRGWAFKLARLISWFWLGWGVLLLGNGLLLLPAIARVNTSYRLLPWQNALLTAVALLVLLVLPALAVWFYHSRGVTQCFVDHGSSAGWLERVSFRRLSLLGMYTCLLFWLHISIFLQGMFPFFGHMEFDRTGIRWIGGCVLITCVLIYGTARNLPWARWGGILFSGLLSLSAGLTFASLNFYELVSMLKVPAYEMNLIQEASVLHNLPLVGLFLPPLLMMLFLAAGLQPEQAPVFPPVTPDESSPSVQIMTS